MQAPVPIRALKVVKSNRFVMGQTVLSRQYIEVRGLVYLYMVCMELAFSFRHLTCVQMPTNGTHFLYMHSWHRTDRP